MYGDTYFDLVNSGSTATSAAGAHLLFGTYQGLSDLGNGEVVNITLICSNIDLRVWNNTVTNNTGLRLTVAASAFDLPPMRVGAASVLHFVREATLNPIALWTVWRRRSGNQ